MPADAGVAFALKGNVTDLNGCSLAGPDGETVDVKARLDNGNGTIVATEPWLINALQDVEILKQVPLPEKAAGSGSSSGSDKAKGGS